MRNFELYWLNARETFANSLRETKAKQNLSEKIFMFVRRMESCLFYFVHICILENGGDYEESSFVCNLSMYSVFSLFREISQKRPNSCWLSVYHRVISPSKKTTIFSAKLHFVWFIFWLHAKVVCVMRNSISIPLDFQHVKRPQCNANWTEKNTPAKALIKSPVGDTDLQSKKYYPQMKSKFRLFSINYKQ